MTTINITLTSICSGGNHLTFTVSGAKDMTVPVELGDLTGPITDDDAQVFCKVVARMAKSGRTNNQARTLLQSGVTVTI